jgi:hypothetical protein
MSVEKELMAKDPWFWATLGNLKLVGGPFKVEGHKYQVEPMISTAKRKAVSKATQMAFTESFVIEKLHKLIYKRYPTGCLYLMPTVDEVRAFSQSRFAPLIASNPGLIGKYVKGTDSAELKRIGSAFLYFRSGRVEKKTEAGHKSSSKLKNIPVDAVVYDELDEMSQVAIVMARGRMKHSEIRDEAFLGNPTIPGYGIDKKFHEGDQRYWELKCKACGHFTNMELEFPLSLRRRKDGTAYRACIHCGKELHPDDGVWVPQVPENSDYMHSWTISQLNSVYEDMTEMLDDWENSEVDRQQYYNLRLGRAYIDAENQLTQNDVYNCCGTELMAGSHWGPCAMGVDVGKVLHVVIGCKYHARNASILFVGRVKSFEDVAKLAKLFNVQSAVFDLNPEQRKVKEFRKAAEYPVYGCYYNEHQKKNAAYDSTVGTVCINRTEMLDTSHEWVVEPGFLEIPQKNKEIGQYVKEMCNVAKVKNVDEFTGDVTFKYKTLGPDHYRHATNYFILALAKLGLAPKTSPKHKKRDAWSMESSEDEWLTGV